MGGVAAGKSQVTISEGRKLGNQEYKRQDRTKRKTSGNHSFLLARNEQAKAGGSIPPYFIIPSFSALNISSMLQNQPLLILYGLTPPVPVSNILISGL